MLWSHSLWLEKSVRTPGHQCSKAARLHLKSSQFIFLLKTCQDNREQLFSETLSHSAVNFALAVWGSCVECGKEVSFSFLLNLYCCYHGAKFKNHFDSVKRIWCPRIFFFSSIKIQEYIQQIFNLHIRLRVTKIHKNVSDPKKLR